MDPKTPAQYAFTILFKQFARAAEGKLNQIMSWNVDREPDFNSVIGLGADQPFDKLLNSLGYIARHKPQPVIDSVMLWRKDKIENPSDPPDAPFHRRNLSDGALVERSRDTQAILNERRAQATLFILCRALIEIVNQVQPNALGDHGSGLEDIVFKLLKTSDQDVVQRTNREACFNLYAELMGSLSNIRFATVSDRFVAELEKYKSFAPNILRESEAKVTTLIRGMRFLKLKIYPIEALEETADFLQSIAGFLRLAHGPRIKHAYARLFVQLLLPIAGVTVAEVNFPAWVKAVEVLYPKAWKMTDKPRHWDVAYPFATTLLCVSQKDFFTQHWWACAEACIGKFKDKDRRQMAMECLIRLVWTFLYRCPESTSATQKKLDTISRSLFPPGRRGILPSDINLELFVLYVYFVGFKQQNHDYCMKSLIYELMNSEVTNPVDIAPERVNISIRAFMLLLAAIQSNEGRPPFPSNTDLHHGRGLLAGLRNSADILPENFFTRPNSKENFEKFCDTVYKIASVVDSHYGNLLVLEEKHLASRNPLASTSNAGVVSQISETIVVHSYASMSVSYPREKQPYLDLLRTYVDSLPRLLPSNARVSRIVEMLCRYTVHVDPDLAKSAARALGRIARQCGAKIVITGFSRFVYRIEDKYAEILAGVGPGMGTKFGGVLKLYLELLRVWLDQLRSKATVDHRSIAESPISTEAGGVDDPNVWTIIEETEANGLLFLCSSSCLIRKYAVNILTHVAELGSEIDQKSQPASAPEGIFRFSENDQKSQFTSVPEGVRCQLMLFPPPLKADEIFPNAPQKALNPFLILRRTAAIQANKLGIEIKDRRAFSKMITKIWSAASDEDREAYHILYEEVYELQRSYQYDPSRRNGSDASSGSSLPVVQDQLNNQAFDDDDTDLEQSSRNTLPGMNVDFSKSIDDLTLVGDENINDQEEDANGEKLLYSASGTDNKLPYTRVIHVLSRGGRDLFNFDKLTSPTQPNCLTIVEQIRLQKLQQQGKKDILLRLVESENQADAVIWSRCFPDFMKICFDYFPVTVALCRNNVCTRIVQMQQAIIAASETLSRTPNGSLSMARFHTRPLSPTEEIIGQWKSYLIVACSTFTQTDDYADRIWKRSVSVTPERITSARSLFKRILGFLSSENNHIRDAVVIALGNIQENAYKVLLEDLQHYIKIVNDEYRANPRHPQRAYATVHKRARKSDRLRTEIAHVLQLTSHFLLNTEHLRDSSIESMIMNFVRDTMAFLSEPDTITDWEFQKLRQYFCGLVEKLYDGISRLKNAKSEMEIMPFDMRIKLFGMFEEWCGHGPKGQQNRDREGRIISSRLEQYPRDSDERRPFAAQLETERKALEFAALNAMASLCRGPLFVKDSNDKPFSFDMKSIFKWIESVFASPQDKLHPIARRAIEGLLISNPNIGYIMDNTILRCYNGNPSSKSTQGYFLAIAQTLFNITDYPLKPHSKIVALALFKAGDPELEIRKNAIKLLKLIEKRFFDDSCSDEYEVGITSKLSSIYKQSQIALSTRLAQNARKRSEEKRKQDEENLKREQEKRKADNETQAGPSREEKVYEETHYMISEFMMRFEAVGEKSHRDMLNYILPWLRNIDFIATEDGELHPTTKMIISNLFFITMKYGDIYVKEIEQAWQQLVTGEHVNNVRDIVKYLIYVGLEKRNPNFVIHAKRVFVYLGRTPACKPVIERLINEINPKSMTPQPRENGDSTKKQSIGLYYANFDEILPAHNKRPVFSASQLAMLYMVDMAVETGSDLQIHLPLLLHVVFVQLDSANSLISEESRALLINLIHSIIIGKSVYPESVKLGHLLVQELNAKGPQLLAYEDITYQNRSLGSLVDLDRLSKDVTNVFGGCNNNKEEFRQMWGETALQWATSCPVRHIACRSFQIFRSLRPVFNENMLVAMLARLSNTIADTSDEVQGFALEILITLSDVVDWLEPGAKDVLPQMIWATIACLQTINEPEYLEALTILDKLLNKYDFNGEENQVLFRNYYPELKWQGQFEGIQPLLLKGIRSALSMEPTFRMLQRLMYLPDYGLVDPSESRLLYLILANLPRMLVALNNDMINDECLDWAQNLAFLAEQQDRQSMMRVFTSYLKGRYKQKDDDFLKQVILVIRDNYFPDYAAPAILFLMGLLSNNLAYFKLKTMRIIKMLLPYVDTQRPEFTGIGSELILPLLRLLQTSHAQDALEVLDETISITGGPKDKHILRMSINAKSDPKDFDTNASLFGVPDKSGWAIPDPVSVAEKTRCNVCAVCDTCRAIDSEYPLFLVDSPGYETPNRRHQISEIVSTLEDLEGYFLPTAGDGINGNGSFNDGDRSSSIVRQDLGDDEIDQNQPEYYETRADAIIERSLSKSPSLGSLGSFAEPFATHASSPSESSPTKVKESDEVSRLHTMSSTSSTEEDEIWLDDNESILSENNSTFQLESLLQRTQTPVGPFSHGTTPSM